VTGGKNKYLINGSNVQNNRVKDLFCSVQLNVNNPHFLIMQGRITKVLNMKPPEVITEYLHILPYTYSQEHLSVCLV
jgi:structural maintenance of chromosome 2